MAVTTPVLPKVMNVLCIDDSKTILALMKKILIPENGFKVVATADNGLQGLEEMKKHKIDVITLDLHMPELCRCWISAERRPRGTRSFGCFFDQS